jgi:hypothetical protein
MRDSLMAILGLVIISTYCRAADVPAPPPGGVAAAPTGGLVISSQICATLPGAGPNNATSAVPSAEYQPGVDANGNAVAPADLPAAPAAPSVDNFPIEINQRFARNFNLPPGGNAKGVLGYVTVRDNQTYFNGQPLNADQASALAEACRNARH